MESATVLQTPILSSIKIWLKDYMKANGLGTYGDAISHLIKEYEILIDTERVDRMRTFGTDEEEYDIIFNRVMDVYERSLMTPTQIDAMSPSEVFEAEFVIERALEVLHGIKMVDDE